MAIYKLDKDGKPIRAGSRKQPVEKGGKFHFRYQIRKSGKHPKDMTRHFWATDEDMPKIVRSFENGKPIETAKGLKWKDALKYWEKGNRLASSGHVASLSRNIDYLCEFYDNPNLTIESTTKGMFRRWLNERASVSNATANKSREIMAVAQYAYEELDLLDSPPEFVGIKKYLTAEKKKKAIPVEDVNKYLEATKKHYGEGLTLIIEFFLFSGVRSTEGCELTKDRIGDTITIFQKAKGAGKREAEVIADEYLRDILKRAERHKKAFIGNCRKIISEAEEVSRKYANDKLRLRKCEAKIEKYKKQIKNASGNHVFINNVGTAWNKDSVRRNWKKCCDEAGLKYFVPHELRHTHATLAGGAGFSERFIQAAMRWDDPTMAKRYVHETKNMARDVAESVRGILAESLGRKKITHKITVDTKNLVAPIEITCPCCNKLVIISPKKK